MFDEVTLPFLLFNFLMISLCSSSFYSCSNSLSPFLDPYFFVIFYFSCSILTLLLPLRATASISCLKELNPYVDIYSSVEVIDDTTDLTRLLSHYQCAIFTDTPLDLLKKINQFCRTHKPPINVRHSSALAGNQKGTHSLFLTSHYSHAVHHGLCKGCGLIWVL